MECGSILCNASLNASKLNKHFQSVHDEKGTEIDMIKKRARFDQKGTFSVLGVRATRKAYFGGLV